MKWIRGSQGGKTFYGILEDDRVTPAVSYTHLTLPTNREV